MIYHVTMSNGRVYGVAATGKREAMTMAQERAMSDGTGATPQRADSVGRGGPTWTYGAVLAY